MAFFFFYIESMSITHGATLMMEDIPMFLAVVLNAAFTQPQAQSSGCRGLGKGKVLNFSTLKVWEKL